MLGRPYGFRGHDEERGDEVDDSFPPYDRVRRARTEQNEQDAEQQSRGRRARFDSGEHGENEEKEGRGKNSARPQLTEGEVAGASPNELGR